MSIFNFAALTSFIFIVLFILAAESVAFFAEMSLALLFLIAVIIALVLLLLIDRGVFRRA